MTDAEFQAAFDQHKDAVYRFAWRMSGSAAAAEDITQDVFVGLLRYPDRFDPAPRDAARLPARDRPEPRAQALADGTSVRAARRRAAVVAEPVDLERGDVGDIVGRAVRALRPLQREVVILVEYEGLTLAEIARAVDADVGTVKSRLHRARENLRRIARAAAEPATDHHVRTVWTTKS